VTVTREDKNEVFDGSGRVVSSATVQVDVTSDAVLFDLATKARAALAVNDTYLSIATPNGAQVAAQVARLTRECSALIRLQGHVIDGLEDLMRDNKGT